MTEYRKPKTLTQLESENARLREVLSDAEENNRLFMHENDRLRKERDTLLMNATPTAAELRRVRAAWKEDRTENAKLRELVRSAVMHCDSGTCDGCPILGKDESCPYSDMARELGVEVNDG